MSRDLLSIIYGCSAKKLDYIDEMCNKYDVVCIKEQLFNLEHYGYLQIDGEKVLFIHKVTVATFVLGFRKEQLLVTQKST